MGSQRRGGQQQVGAVGETLAEGGALAIGIVAAGFGGELRGVEVATLAGHDIDDAEHGVVAIGHRAGARHVLDALDQGQVEQAGFVDIGLVEQRVLRHVAIDQHHDATGVVARGTEATPAEVLVAPVAGGVQAAHAVDHVADGAIAIGANVLGGDDGDSRRRVADLAGEGRAGDDLALDQLLERHRGQVAATLGHCRRRRQGQAQGDTQARQPDAPFMPDRDCAHHPPPLWSLHLLLRIG